MLKWILPSRLKRQVGAAAADQTSQTRSGGLLAAVVVSIAAVLLTTAVLFLISSHLAAQHLVLGYLLPTMFIAVYFGSTIAVLTAFVSGLAAAYFLFPPKFSFYVSAPEHVAELGLFFVLAVIASKAVAALSDDAREHA